MAVDSVDAHPGRSTAIALALVWLDHAVRALEPGCRNAIFPRRTKRHPTADKSQDRSHLEFPTTPLEKVEVGQVAEARNTSRLVPRSAWNTPLFRTLVLALQCIHAAAVACCAAWRTTHTRELVYVVHELTLVYSAYEYRDVTVRELPFRHSADILTAAATFALCRAAALSDWRECQLSRIGALASHQGLLTFM